MEKNWNTYEGNLIGIWLLESFLGERDGRAFYSAADTQNGGSVLVQLVAAGNAADALLWSWKRAKDLTHDHLMPVLGCGEVNLDESLLAFAVQDLPSDDLSERISRNPSAARDESNADATLAALNYLHVQGLCHGAVIPGNIFYLGDVLALGVDTLQPANPAGIARDEQQFAAIFAKSKPSAASQPSRSSSLHHGIAIATLTVAAVLILIYVTLHRSQPHAAALSPVQVSPVQPAQVQPELGSADRTASPHRPTAPWAVISATYNGFQAADERARRLRRSAPKLNPHVLPREGKGQRYFVVLGSGLTKDEAERLRRTAIADGAPGDTYVTKFAQD